MPGSARSRRPADVRLVSVAPSPWSATPSCWSWTSRPPRWTSRPAARSGNACTPAWPRAARCCSPPTDWRRPTPWPAASSSWPAGGCSPTAPPTRSEPKPPALAQQAWRRRSCNSPAKETHHDRLPRLPVAGGQAPMARPSGAAVPARAAHHRVPDPDRGAGPARTAHRGPALGDGPDGGPGRPGRGHLGAGGRPLARRGAGQRLAAAAPRHPASPSAAVAAKIAVAMSFALPAITLVAATGGLTSHVSLEGTRWIELVALMWLATAPITALGAL